MKKNFFKKKSSVVFVFAILLCFIFSSCELSYNAKNKKEEKGTLRVISVGCDFKNNPRLMLNGKDIDVAGLFPDTVNDAFHVGLAFSALAKKTGMACDCRYLIGKNPENRGYPSEFNEVNSLDSDFRTLFAQFDDIKSKGSQKDIVVVYFSTHGHSNDTKTIQYGDNSALKNNILILASSEGNKAESKTYEELFDAISSLPGTKIVISDCCYSGSFITDNWVTVNPAVNSSVSPMKILFSSEKIAVDQNTFCISASKYSEKSQQMNSQKNKTYTYGTHGWFCKSLLYALGWNEDNKSLQSAIPAQKGKRITLSSLYKATEDRFYSIYKLSDPQHPVFGEASADIVLFQF